MKLAAGCVAVLVVAVVAGVVLAYTSPGQSSTGTVQRPTVAGDAVFAAFDRCTMPTDDVADVVFDCFVEAAADAKEVFPDDSVHRLATFAEDPVRGGRFAGVCHEVLQEVGGRHAYSDVVEHVPETDDPCLTGYVHGVLSHVVVDVADEEVLAASSERCPTQFSDVLCMHMAGHVLVERHPDPDDFRHVLELCGATTVTLDEFPPGVESEGDAHARYPRAAAAFQCADGAFMEQLTGLASQIRRDRHTIDGVAVSTDDVLSNCVELADLHPMIVTLCLTHAGALLFVLSGNDMVDTVEACRFLETTEVSAGLQRCVAATMVFVAAFAGYEPEQLVSVCGDLEGDVRVACASGADRVLQLAHPTLDRPVCSALFTDPETCVLSSRTG